jgi:nickel transport protein
MKWRLVTILLVFLLTLGSSATAFAHGVALEYKTDVVVEILAAYDNGEPMSWAQVKVYAPDEPSTPWLTGVCDENGCFTFTPDPSTPGTWSVQVSYMVHGGWLHIPIGEGVVGAGGTGYTQLQLALMAGCVIWGFIGTALFFSRRRGG